MRNSSRKKDKANSLEGHSKANVEAGKGRAWYWDDKTGDRVRQKDGKRERKIQTVEPEKPKKRTPAHDVGPSRRAHAKETKSQEITIPLNKSTFLDFTNGKSYLNREELERYVNAWTSSKAEQRLQGRDFDWILASADRNQDACIDFTELPHVQAAVNSYLETSRIIKKIFTKHDKNRDGVLEHKELQNLLTKLNDKVPVPDSEVEWVMHIAETETKGKVTQDELLHAINFWYNYIEDIEVDELPTDRHKGGIVGRALSALHRDSKKGKLLKGFLSTVSPVLSGSPPAAPAKGGTGSTSASGGKVSRPSSPSKSGSPSPPSSPQTVSPPKSGSPPPSTPPKSVSPSPSSTHGKRTRAMGA
eukprot:gnl/MRDRNA2_/MRDRNA2_66429_c0_seq1.p1 gnl/MRDRNA2_/MRDRNA2_66429_c0~~gnl/MRDRNA2_/MRDRNA2_66429_c0_seq1.p1  ORF type:complete len:360 (+),score=80.16 gnl/MRDRNA2_/MRDRNA2_66429_c0_seq1:73-1152(+)